MRTLLLLAALAAFAPAAQAQPAPLTIEQAPREAGARHRPHLFISPAGEPFRAGDGLAAWFAGADADHDGALSRAEFRADALRAFRLFDVNGDGRLDGFEIQAYERERVPEIAELSFDEGRGRGGAGRTGGRGRGGHRGGAPRGAEDHVAGGPSDDRLVGAGREGAARYSLLNEPQPLLAADEDLDGKVSLEEWLHATARRFDRLDRQKSGQLTLAALRSPPARR